jgi:predicted amidohydrolase
MAGKDGVRAVSRRGILQGATGTGLAAMLGASPAWAQTSRGAPVKVDPNGGYARVPLAKDSFTLGVAQCRVMPVDLANLKQSRKANLDHMLGLIDASTMAFGKPDLLFFHEFPITGWNNWTLAETLRVAIDIPGQETDAIARKAKEHGMYIVFGSYARDPDWPGRALSITTIIDPSGAIIARNWKARNLKGLFGGDTELFTTTIYDVLDRYVEMYGEDAVIPIARTPIGNIFTSSIQREPEYFRAAAIKGAEVMLRTATGGFSPVDMQATALYNGVYTAVCNNAISPGSPFFEDTGAGGSAIYGSGGETLDTANSPNETLVMARIPIAQFRARHRQPTLHKELYMAEYEQYVPPYPPNLFQDYQPTDLHDAGRYLRGRGRWK